MPYPPQFAIVPFRALQTFLNTANESFNFAIIMRSKTLEFLLFFAHLSKVEIEDF